MKLWRKILYTVIFIALGVLMICATVKLFSDLSKASFFNWLKIMTGAVGLGLYGVYIAFSKGEWAEKHPRSARIADVCGWIGIVLHAVWIWMRWVL